jgi:hypothetical protein
MGEGAGFTSVTTARASLDSARGELTLAAQTGRPRPRELGRSCAYGTLAVLVRL